MKNAIKVNLRQTDQFYKERGMSSDMLDKNKVQIGQYDHKTQGLNFGYEYTTGNRTNENKSFKVGQKPQKKK